MFMHFPSTPPCQNRTNRGTSALNRERLIPRWATGSGECRPVRHGPRPAVHAGNAPLVGLRHQPMVWRLSRPAVESRGASAPGARVGSPGHDRRQQPPGSGRGRGLRSGDDGQAGHHFSAGRIQRRYAAGPRLCHPRGGETADETGGVPEQLLGLVRRHPAVPVLGDPSTSPGTG